MNAKNQPIRVLIIVLALILLALPVTAQETNPQEKNPPAKDPSSKDPRVSRPVEPQQPIVNSESSSQVATEPAPTATVAPDTTPLSGTQEFSLGILGAGRDFVYGGIHFFQGLDSNAQSAAGGTTDWRARGAISGNVSLQKVFGQNQLNLNYSGGVSFPSINNQRHNLFPVLSLRQSFAFRRYILSVANTFAYSPESFAGSGGLGYGGIGGITGINRVGNLGGFQGYGGAMGGGISPSLLPNQTIVTGQSSRVANTTSAQVQYILSNRNSLVVSGGYSFLKFLDGNFIDSSTIRANVGFDRLLSATDSVAISYQVALNRFENSPNSVDTHTVFLNYGKRLTGRMSLQLGAGPRVGVFNNQLTGSNSQVGWSMFAAFHIMFPLTNLGLRYSRGITGGSGVLQGANSDRVELFLGRPIGRHWQASLRFGYAYNTSLRQTTSGNVQANFHGFQAGSSLNRPVGHAGSVNFNYAVLLQNSSIQLCTPGTPSCGNRILRHTFTLGYSWGFGPIRLD
jgi:hypothetical protein